MVTSRKMKLRKGDADDTDLKQIDPSAFTYVLINSVQEQQRTIEQLEARLARMERGFRPAVSEGLPGGLGTGVALGLLPLGLVIATRKRKSGGQG